MSARRKEAIARFIARAEKWALAHPGEEYRKTIVTDDVDGFCAVSRWFYEEACLESEYVGEVFAIKEPGKPVYSSFDEQ